MFRTLPQKLAALAAVALVTACTTPSPQPNEARIEATWVELGPDGQAMARAIVAEGATCPVLTVDGTAAGMSLRAPAGTPAQRTTASPAADSKPSNFPVAVCEAALPRSARQADIAGRPLPLPKALPQRIAIFGDSGCRIKKSDQAYQSCNDAAAWPFPTVAASIAKLNPDIVLHVGDYEYRETSCPPGLAGCQGSPWGYGWDAWRADLFEPAAPLLAKAPWIMARGNHEECARAGQGWARFLDPYPYTPARSCDDPAFDAQGNYSEPYALPLGDGSQLIVFDSAKAGRAPLPPSDPRYQTYQRQFRAVAELAARPGMADSIFVAHHPILAFAPIPGRTPVPATPELQDILYGLYGQAYFPPGIQAAVHGHVHDYQMIDFASGQPAAVVSGTGGDNLDTTMPDPFPAGLAPAPGTAIAHISHDSRFGFLMMERQAAPANGWLFKAYSAAGELLETCALRGKRMACDKGAVKTR